MKRYVYKRKDNGRKVTSDKPLKDKNLVLLSRTVDTQLKSNDITRKLNR